jgi:hypothetical protein
MRPGPAPLAGPRRYPAVTLAVTVTPPVTPAGYCPVPAGLAAAHRRRHFQ